MKKDTKKDTRPFAERHPRWNFVIGIILLLLLTGIACCVVFAILYYIGIGISEAVSWISSLTSNLDAVVIVALITGSVSITGVIISSIVAKGIDYRKSRQDYLAQKREKPYGEFVDMIYKMQQNIKKNNSYTEKQMMDDISKFSRELTLWGSSKVVNKWVKFRGNGVNPDSPQEFLFIMEDIMNEMRKDLGLRKVKKGNLLAFFINDIKQSMKTMKK